jgi:hypothetical protein
MIRTVTALFDDTAEAEAAMERLTGQVRLMKGAIVTCGPGEKPEFGTIYLSRAQREACEGELADGGSLLIAQVEGNEAAELTVDLLDRHASDGSAGANDSAPAIPLRSSPAPIGQPRPAPTPARAAGVPISTSSRRPESVVAETEPAPAAQSKPAPPEPARTPQVAQPAAARPARPIEAEERIPIVEEELRIGKRALVRGGARVHSFMEEVPVTEQVELLEERTSIEHRPVNRRLTEEEIAASGLLQDRVVEIAQMREEAVITKEAFVREELVVKKTIEKRVEQVHETIRRTAVEMERLEPELAGGAEDRPIRRG